MKSENPLNIDPSDVVVNENGDVVPPTDEVFQRRNLKENAELLRQDHPGIDLENTALIRGIKAAKDLIEAPMVEESEKSIPGTASNEAEPNPPLPAPNKPVNKAVIGSRVPKKLTTSETQNQPPKSQSPNVPEFGNPEGYSPAAARRKEEILKIDFRAAAAAADAARAAANRRADQMSRPQRGRRGP